MEQWLRPRAKVVIDPVVEILARLGVSPNGLTLFGCLLNVAAGMLIGLGHVQWGGVLMTFVAMPMDALDGSLARKLGKESKFGAFFDSVLDRYAEGALLLGLAWHFVAAGDTTSVVVTVAALVGSLMVSYTRARAEGIGVECKIGLFSRFGRFALLAIGLLTNQPVIMVWLLAILSNVTAAQRVAHVLRATSRQV